jgi:hypothetical protein
MVAGANSWNNISATLTPTTLAPAPSCVPASWTRDVWYTFAVPSSGCSSITVNTAGTTGANGWGQASADTVLAVYSGTYNGTAASLTQLACNDDFTGLGLLSQVTIPIGTPPTGIPAGATLTIRLGSWGTGATNQGTGNCNIICNP